MSRSRSRRAYLAVGAEGLRSIVEDGPLGSPRANEPAADGGTGAAAYAVTAASRALYPGSDEEDLEYEAMRAARQACASQGALPVVLAVDVPDEQVVDGGFGASPTEVFTVRLTEPVPRNAVVSAHAELDGRDEELSWYDATELDQLVALLAAR